MSSDAKVPVIDLAVLRRPLEPACEDRRSVVLDLLSEACSTCGVFYLENHGVPPQLLRRVMSEYDSFFDLPLEERMEIALQPGEVCGYEPLESKVRELNDSFHCVFGGEEFPELRAMVSVGTNRWPRHPADLESVTRETMRALHRVGVDVMGGLAMSLGLPVEYFDSILFDPAIGDASHTGSLRARRYPAQQGVEGFIGTEDHVDGPPLALIIQNDVPGLQTEVAGSGWATIAPKPDTLVCQLGSVFSLWTNDRYVPNRHRVRNDDPTRDRRSLIYWFPIHPEAMLSCVPTCCDAEAPPRYEPVRYTQYLVDWVRRFAEQGEATNDGSAPIAGAQSQRDDQARDADGPKRGRF